MKKTHSPEQLLSKHIHYFGRYKVSENYVQFIVKIENDLFLLTVLEKLTSGIISLSLENNFRNLFETKSTVIAEAFIKSVDNLLLVFYEFTPKKTPLEVLLSDKHVSWIKKINFVSMYGMLYNN